VLSLQPKPKLGRTKPSTGPHAALGPQVGHSCSRRTTQTMSAARNSPTIGLKLRALPLTAVTVSLHYLPRCLRSIVTCGKTPTVPP